MKYQWGKTNMRHGREQADQCNEDLICEGSGLPPNLI